MSRRRRMTENDELEEIRKGFEMFDVEGTGIINPLELLEAMDSMNIKEKNPFIYEIIESLASEKEFRNNGVKLEELVEYVYNKVNDTESNVGLRQIFDVINDRDTDNVSMSTFYTLARDYGDQLSEDEIRYLLEKTQMGGSELTFDEFYTIMKGAIRNNKSNSSFMNMSRSSYKNNKNNDIYMKKSSNPNSIKKSIIDNNKKIRTKKFLYEEPKHSEPQPEKEIEDEKELNQPLEERPLNQEGQQPQKDEEQYYVENVITTTKIINQNEVKNSNDMNYINDENNNNDMNYVNDENNNNDDMKYTNDKQNDIYSANKEEVVETEVRYEISENIQKENDNKNIVPHKYSYRKIHIGTKPKYEKVEEKIVTVEEKNNINENDLNDNLKINQNIENDERNYRKERQTKITNLPDGGKQVEITEKTEIVKERPYIRGNRFRFSRKNDVNENNNNEDEKKQEKNTFYRIRRPRGSDQKDKDDQVSMKKVEVEENSEVIIPKRYHRRYRETKTTTTNDN